MNTPTHSHAHTCFLRHTLSHTHVHPHPHTHTYTHLNIYTHTHTHTYTHIYVYICTWCKPRTNNLKFRRKGEEVRGWVICFQSDCTYAPMSASLREQHTESECVGANVSEWISVCAVCVCVCSLFWHTFGLFVTSMGAIRSISTLPCPRPRIRISSSTFSLSDRNSPCFSRPSMSCVCVRVCVRTLARVCATRTCLHVCVWLILLLTRKQTHQESRQSYTHLPDSAHILLPLGTHCHLL